MTSEWGFFFQMTLEVQTTKKVFNKLDFSNIRNFSTTEHSIIQVKKECHRVWKDTSKTGIYKSLFENRQNGSACEKMSKWPINMKRCSVSLVIK